MIPVVLLLNSTAPETVKDFAQMMTIVVLLMNNFVKMLWIKITVKVLANLKQISAATKLAMDKNGVLESSNA